MQFITTFITAVLCFGALVESGEPPQKRSLADYLNQIDLVDNQIQVVTAAIDNYVAGVVSVDVPLDEGWYLVQIVNECGNYVQTFDPLSTVDALSLVIPIQNMIDDLTIMVDAFISAKPNFDADGASNDVLAILEALETAVEYLVAALVSKVPSALKSLVAALGGVVVDEIQRGILAYTL